MTIADRQLEPPAEPIQRDRHVAEALEDEYEPSYYRTMRGLEEQYGAELVREIVLCDGTDAEMLRHAKLYRGFCMKAIEKALDFQGMGEPRRVETGEEEHEPKSKTERDVSGVGDSPARERHQAAGVAKGGTHQGSGRQEKVHRRRIEIRARED